MPAMPMAAPQAPSRAALPNESEMMTATVAPVNLRMPSRMARAEASGFSGRRTAWPSERLPAFDMSTPAPVPVKPSRWTVTT